MVPLTQKFFIKEAALKRSISTVLLLMLAWSTQLLAETQRWPEEKANAWYQQQPWLVGSNFIPASAINELKFQVVAEATVVTEYRSTRRNLELWVDRKADQHARRTELQRPSTSSGTPFSKFSNAQAVEKSEASDRNHL